MKSQLNRKSTTFLPNTQKKKKKSRKIYKKQGKSCVYGKYVLPLQAQNFVISKT